MNLFAKNIPCCLWLWASKRVEGGW